MQAPLGLRDFRFNSRSSEAVPPQKLDPGNYDRGAPDHRIDGLENLLLAGGEPRDPIDEELQVSLDRSKIDVLRITSRHDGVVIVGHRGGDAR